MSNCISELSSHSLRTWFSELSQQVTALGVLLDASEEQQKQQGYYHTLHEICQQPLTWIDTAARVRANRNRLNTILTESGIQDQRGSIIMTGSGSSLFVGECLDMVLQRALEVPVQAVAAGRILTHPALALPPGQIGRAHV